MSRKQFTLPTHDIDRELAAESIRLYLQNPEHIKEFYPKVAKAVRKLVNNNKFLKGTVQFNSVLAATILYSKANKNEKNTEL